MASLRKWPISKLSILFILAILIPGLVLSFFSIQNIASQKELTEKRLMEEQTRFASVLSNNFERLIQDFANNFFKDVREVDNYDTLLLQLSGTNHCISRFFILDYSGSFILPLYLPETAATKTISKNEAFTEALLKAEKSEFSDNNLNYATTLYDQAGKLATSNLERAISMNGIGRVQIKRGLYRSGYETYKKLAKQYGSIVDDSGFPFAYYSIHQMINAASSIDSKIVIHDLKVILEGLLSGDFPISDQSSLIIQEIKTWFSELGQNNSDEKLTIYIQAIEDWIYFFNNESKYLSEYIRKKDPNFPAQRFAGFEAVLANQWNRPLLFLLSRDLNRQIINGIQINLEQAKSELTTLGNLNSDEFELSWHIVPINEVNQFTSELKTVHGLSPLIPMWRIIIHPRNPEALHNLIVRQRWLYGISVTLLLAGMLLGVVLILRDVSREQRLASLRSDFVSNVTHELKTPLTSIRMFAETIRLGRIRNKREQQDHLKIIVNESERLTRLINTVLDFSKIEQGNKQYQKCMINVRSVIQSALDTLEYPLVEKDFTLKTNIKKDIRTFADGDAIEQAVLNLLTNSMKYSKNQKEIFISTRIENAQIFIEVKDKGIGIAETDQKHIFEKYYRIQSYDKKGSAGAGLGLTVVKHIVEAHDGRIKVDSKLGQGTTFTIIIPEIIV